MNIEDKYNINGIAQLMIDDMNEYKLDIDTFEDFWPPIMHSLRSRSVESPDISIIKGLVYKKVEQYFESIL
jgi:hypothetical protein